MRRKSESPKSRLLSERQTNVLTGKALVGALTPKEQLRIMEHLGELYFLLDREDDEDRFGSEGWRHHFRLPEDD